MVRHPKGPGKLRSVAGPAICAFRSVVGSLRGADSVDGPDPLHIKWTVVGGKC